MVVDLGELERAVEAGTVTLDEMQEIAQWQRDFLGLSDRIVELSVAMRDHRLNQPPPICDHTPLEPHDLACTAHRIRYQARLLEISDASLIMVASMMAKRAAMQEPACLAKLGANAPLACVVQIGDERATESA